MDATILLQVALTLVGAALVELPVAAFYTRRRVRADVRAEVDALRAKLDELKPKELHPGLIDPRDAAQLRWAKKAEAEAKQAETKTAIFAWLVERFGPEQARVIQAWCPPDVMDAAVKAGDHWRPLLEPVITAAQKHRKGSGVTAPAAPAWTAESYG